MQTTTQATKCSKDKAYVTPQRNNPTTYVLPEGKNMRFTSKFDYYVKVFF